MCEKLRVLSKVSQEAWMFKPTLSTVNNESSTAMQISVDIYLTNGL